MQAVTGFVLRFCDRQQRGWGKPRKKTIWRFSWALYFI